MILSAVIFLLIFPSIDSTLGWPRRDPISLAAKRLQAIKDKEGLPFASKKYQWEEKWYSEMPIDHFAFGDARKFKLR
jgi:hypothetical protein